MKTKLFYWGLRIVVAAIFAQTLFFKFTAAEESVYIFSQLGVEPYGRIGTGILELVATILILIPRTVLLGALLGLGIISGAILSHLFVIGIKVMNDGGTLFLLALTVFLGCIIIIYQNRSKLPALFKLKF